MCSPPVRSIAPLWPGRCCCAEAPRPDPETPAPVRFLPLYDNVYLGYDNRRRMLSEATAHMINMLQDFKPAVLVDGTVAAGWAITVRKARRRSRSNATAGW